ncbi:MAG TPA: tyrosine--tRNA ligase [Candidatus Paceibacterota bacterium]|nr:tyrosine--tRNA ligase [Candidatus Paceibacterota bacterium]
MAKLSEILKERGYVHQFSSKKLEEITDGEKRVVYLGIDPSADSLHVGNLVGLLVLRRFLEDGHKVIILTGGGTGMIGDPGGRSEERNLLDEETVAKNSEAVGAQIRKVFGGEDFIEENNATWLTKLNLLEFLRDIGKYFTVNAMIKKDMVRDRLEKESPLSFTEFSYSLLQGYDFLHLNEAYGCDVQVGGSDQWSNILAGVEFIRRKTEKTVYAFTWPLVVNKSTGKKFGKSEQGAIWLDPEKTSPFQFYQFWLNMEDESVKEYLLKMTMLSNVEIDAALELHKRDAKERHGQKLLARAVTILVHGEETAEECERISHILFGEGTIDELDEKGATMLRASAPSTTVSEEQPIADVLIASKLAGSKREVRQFLKDEAVTLNGKVLGEDYVIAKDDFKNGLAILKRGKRNVCVLTLA